MEWQLLQRHSNHPNVQLFSICFCDSLGLLLDATHWLQQSRSWVGIQIWRHMEILVVLQSLHEERASFCCNWKPISSSTNTLFFERAAPIFIDQVLDTIGQSTSYFSLLSLSQHLMSLGQIQKLCTMLLVGWNSFVNPLVVGARVPFLPLLQFHCTKSQDQLALLNNF